MTGRREVLPLKTDTGRLFTINREYLSDLVRELETFLDGEDFMNNRTFSKKVLFTHEIKANNTVEGINDSDNFYGGLFGNIELNAKLTIENFVTTSSASKSATKSNITLKSASSTTGLIAGESAGIIELKKGKEIKNR